MSHTYQVYSKDRYGRHEVISSLSTKGRPESEWVTAEEALEAAKRYVHDKNRNTSMTFDEQRRLASHVVFLPDDGSIYAGNLIMARHKAFVKTASGEDEARIEDTIPGRFYLGQTPDNEPWLLTDPRKRPVTLLTDEIVREQTLLFVKRN